jgi:hypothetical protein
MLTAASNADSDDRPTTPPAGIAVAASAEPTPGQRVAERQREIFIRDRFVAVFGADVIDALEIDWGILADIQIPFENSRKRELMHQLKGFLRQQDRSGKFIDNQDFDRLYNNILRLSSSIEIVHEDRLEEHARRYFTTGRFEGARVEFRAKSDGDQMGRIAFVTPPHGPTIKYYIKTHAKGRKAERSSAAQPVNAIELMVYKVLERSRVGCEVHFFGRDELNFYIATRDANEHGGFTEYIKIKRSDKATRAPFWGVLSEVLHESAAYNAAHFEEVESALAHDELAQHFIHQMSFSDLLARLMLLTDLQTNGDNFGFVSHPAPILKVIDFRLCEVTRREQLQLNERSFGGFLEGNGTFDYPRADEAVAYALRNRPVPLRVAEARSVFDRELSNWERLIDDAQRGTIDALRQTTLLPEEQARLIEEVVSYTDTLRGNFRLFETSLRQWRE